ncbi:MAG: leucine-rich repeat domain-containing protein [Clostridia bacterium]|nr:leucine-rich repeat domain-containing protein [Clostridia bacterium]
MKKFLAILVSTFLISMAGLTLTACGECEHGSTSIKTTVEATCTQTGIQKTVCDDCGEVLEEKTLPKLSHIPGEWEEVTEATCQASGVKHKKCTICFNVLEVGGIDKLAHTPGEWVTINESTCKESGSKKQLCADCETILNIEEIEKLPHTESDWMVDKNATCIEKGSKHIECTECKATLKTEEIDFIDHNYVYGECDVCDKIDTTYMSEGLAFELINNGNEYSVNGYISGYTGNSTELLIPAIYRGKAVTTIKESAFANNTIIEKVILPDSIKTVEHAAFNGCANLSKVNYLGTIDQWAVITFDNASNPIKITGDLYIKDVLQTEITINVKTIGKWAFANCKSITKVTLGENVEEIDNSAFRKCTALESINLPKNFKYIDSEVFSGCENLKTVAVADNSKLEIIADEAFYNCTSLENIKIPSTIKYITTQAFYNCTSLTMVEIPSTITSIGGYAFGECSNLTIYTDALEGQIKCSETWAVGVKQVVWGTNYYTEGLIFELKTDNEEEYRITGYEGTEENVVIPSTYSGKKVTSIEVLIEYDSPEIEVVKTVQIPNSITYMGSDTLFFGKNLTDVYYMGTVDEWAQIDFKAEQFAEGFNQATLHFNGETFTTLKVNAENISRNAFWGYSHVESVEIGENVTTIGLFAFNGCSNLKEFKVSQNNVHFMAVDGVLYSKDGKTLVCYPHAKEGAIVIPSTVETIGTGAFNWNKLENITIPNTVKIIDIGAFYSCKNLKTVTFEAGSKLESIGGNAFYWCTSLTSIEIPASVKSIGAYAFTYCNSLTIVTFEADSKLASIGDWAFSGCPNLNYTTKDNVKYIGTAENPYLCLVGPVASNISFAVINKDCKIISGQAFEYCSKLKTVIFEEGCQVDIVPYCMFSDCVALETVELSSGVTCIGKGAFQNCTALKSINLPENLTTIEDAAFFNCESLEELILPERLTTIGNSVFRNCVALSTIRIPANVTTFGTLSFLKDYNKEDLNGLVVYTPLTEKPEGWSSSWSSGATSVYWGVDNIEVNGDFIYTLINDGAEYKLLKYVGSESSVKIPSTYNGKNVTKIGDAFNGNKTLTSIEIPSTITAIGYYAFYGCTSLTSIKIPNSVTAIGGQAFFNCASLTSIKIPASVTYVADLAFANCNNLETIYCEAESQPSGWASAWKAGCSAEVVWGYSNENVNQGGSGIDKEKDPPSAPIL